MDAFKVKIVNVRLKPGVAVTVAPTSLSMVATVVGAEGAFHPMQWTMHRFLEVR